MTKDPLLGGGGLPPTITTVFERVIRVTARTSRRKIKKHLGPFSRRSGVALKRLRRDSYRENSQQLTEA